MSQRLLRLWIEGFGADPLYGWVDDWEDGEFTVRKDHSLAAPLWRNCHRAPCVLTVCSTDELEWRVDTVHIGADRCQVRCVPRVKWLRASLLPDDYLVELWLEAEKRWRDRVVLVDALAREMHEVDPQRSLRGFENVAHIYRSVAEKLVDSGWCKDVSSG